MGLIRHMLVMLAAVLRVSVPTTGSCNVVLALLSDTRVTNTCGPYSLITNGGRDIFRDVEFWALLN